MSERNRIGQRRIAFIIITALCVIIFLVGLFASGAKIYNKGHAVYGDILLIIGEISAIFGFYANVDRLILEGEPENATEKPAKAIFQQDAAQPNANGQHVPARIQIEHGMYGGIVGGMVSGVVIGAAYYASMDSLFEVFHESRDGSFEILSAFQVVAPIVALTAFSGGVLGIFIEAVLCIAHKSFNRAGRTSGTVLHLMLSILGGAAAGAIVGPINGVFFGNMDRNVADWSLIVGSAALGMPVVTASLLFYTSNISFIRIIRVTVMAIMFSGTVAALGIIFAWLVGLFGFVTELFIVSVPQSNALGGLIFGVFCGVVFGAGIGTSLMAGSTVVQAAVEGERPS